MHRHVQVVESRMLGLKIASMSFNIDKSTKDMNNNAFVARFVRGKN